MLGKWVCQRNHRSSLDPSSVTSSLILDTRGDSYVEVAQREPQAMRRLMCQQRPPLPPRYADWEPAVCLCHSRTHFPVPRDSIAASQSWAGLCLKLGLRGLHIELF